MIISLASSATDLAASYPPVQWTRKVSELESEMRVQETHVEDLQRDLEDYKRCGAVIRRNLVCFA